MVTQKTLMRAWNNVYSILLDLSLIAMGAIFFYHFQIRMLAPIDLHPVVINLIGDRQLAIYLISGIPFVIGVLNLTRDIFRISRYHSRGKSITTKT